MKRVPAAALSFLFAIACMHGAAAQVQGQWTSTGALQAARAANAQLLLRNGQVLSVGGLDGSGNVLSSAELYTPSKGKWAATGSMTQAREGFAAVLLPNGKVLVAGGLATGNVVSGSAELYTLKTGAWSPAASLATPRFGHTATLLASGQVLVTGGCTASDCSTATPTSELYDPKSNRWARAGSLGAARYQHAAIRLNNGEVLAVGGIAGGVTSSAELYDPATGLWRSAASMNVARTLNGATLLPDGKVLVTGGVVFKYPMNTAELYDPVANSWSVTGTMTSGRYAHSATLLPDGSVVLGGGVGQSYSCGKDCTGYIPTTTSELYTEATGTFAATSKLTQARAYQSATLLSTGRVLVDGGSGTNGVCCTVQSTAEFYTPLSLNFSAQNLNFGLLQTGLASATQTLTVTDVSTHPVSFTGVAATGDYAQSNTCPATLTPGQNCTVSVTFAPSAAGQRTGALTLTDDSPGSPSQTIALTGTGETLALAFTPSSLPLGSVPVGSSSILTATLTNDGAAPVGITGVTISPASHIFTQSNACPATLGVQQSCTFQVVFTPPDVFSYKASLSVANGAGAAATLAVSGTGLDGL